MFYIYSSKGWYRQSVTRKGNVWGPFACAVRFNNPTDAGNFARKLGLVSACVMRVEQV